MAVVHKGRVEGAVIVVADSPELRDGAAVEVVVTNHPAGPEPPVGSREALLSLYDERPACSTDDVAALVQALAEHEQPADERGIFDEQ
jgi:ribosomal protein S16